MWLTPDQPSPKPATVAATHESRQPLPQRAGLYPPLTVIDAMTDTDGGDPEPDAADEHLEELADGAGCAEIWEHLSELREE